MHPGLWLFLVSLCLTKELAEAVRLQKTPPPLFSSYVSVEGNRGLHQNRAFLMGVIRE
ncbi:hypothetical protein U0070_009328 [Myodes glareolus]|uniref:Uncharacterized protein n=1 Tax=Myodes glareolus TaxID=447135 RepID=A0AAW0HQN0_MYOGA